MNPNTPNRRQLLLNLCCLGCSSLSAASAKHRFAEPSNMTYEEVYKFTFQNHFVPVLKGLASQIGKDKFDRMLRKACDQAAAEQTKKQSQSAARRDPAAMLAPLKTNDPFWQHVLNIQIVEETPQAAEVKVTECLWAKVFREANAADIGYSAICYPDFASARAFNPKMKLVRTKTLMQGHDCCNHRWVLESA
jgi:hypothetical protein